MSKNRIAISFLKIGADYKTLASITASKINIKKFFFIAWSTMHAYSSCMITIQTAIHCYQLPNQTERDQALGQILSTEENRKIMALWLKNHPVNIALSPMLQDLRNRITPPLSTVELTSSIEEKILSGKFGQLVEEFKKSPEILLKQLELIKTHVELKTLGVEDIQAILALLLDHASTKDIIAILKAAERPLMSVYYYLSKLQMLRLSVILASPDVPRVEEARLPPFMKEFVQLYQKPQYIPDLKKRIDLTEIEQDIAIAHYIEQQHMPLKDVIYHLSEDAFLRLAPYLRYVDLRTFNNIELGHKFLKNCPHLSTLFIDKGEYLEGIAELPFCQFLVCHQTVVSALPALPLCQQLSCFWCPRLTGIPALPNCQILHCHECNNLTEISDLPLCERVMCYKCPKLTVLPSALPLCKTLDCRDCTELTVLPALPLCITLDCTYTKLETITALPLCQNLYCSNCKNLTALPALPLCEKIDCHNCARLIALPFLPLCEEIDCHDCAQLTALPALPHCRSLNCGGCPLRELPELPWNAHVVSVVEDFSNVDPLPFTLLNVDIEKFTRDPVYLLLQLGNYLNHNKPFPNIYYFEKGERNLAIDFGGVRRDFVTKLCLNLFKENGLKLEDNFPQTTSEADELAYRSLGCLLAQCYPETSKYKTGPLFDQGVYQCMRIPDPGSNEWFLTNYLNFVNAPQAIKQTVYLNQEVPLLQKDDLTVLAYLIESDATDISKYTQDYFSDPRNRALSSKEIIKRAKQDLRLKAISWMAQEFVKRVPAIAANIQERIEGILNKEALKRKLGWDFTYRFVTTQQFLTNWIDNHEDKLEKFVYAVTGNRTLCAYNIKIEVFDRDKDFIPVAHTCFFSLELSGNYENQAVFDQKIDYFLENALAGSGFTAC